MKKKKNKSPLLKLTKESPEARKKRAGSGVKLRTAVFDDKKKRLLEKAMDADYKENQ